MDIGTENRPLPSGYERVSEGPKVVLKKADIPWLESDEEIQLKEVDLVGGGSFLLGSAIRGKRLKSAADQLDSHRKGLVDNLFNSHLPDFVRRNHHPDLRKLVNPATTKPVYCFGNPGGQRVYFTRLDNTDGKPVIIRLAVCDKAKQASVLAVLGGQSIVVGKKRSRSRGGI